ncbi:flagellar basal body rod protein FlgG [Salibacterium halotolerans]|uniref:Flagellar hook protein FlgE n=1 Tax=Salibacterium halotolerans TaxID=1884432 RepID=A0A1I5MDG7_9BACI|nr:flagellar basal body rod protein FlgG [Salibacterium halotolerans]SFP07658.1 flagellar hook protein FlgE [Salibacterium halotolerans]
MLASMYSSISGMKNHQQMLDVTSNNIANVNTYGYKKGRATFKDMISQQIQGATAPGDDMGGSNPMQVGLGTQMGSIDTVHTQGSLQNTGRSLDLGISGDGFFRVGDGTNDFYTRAGNFYLDQDGNMVNSDGYYVLDDSDNGAQINIPVDAQSFSIGSDGTVSYTDVDGDTQEAGTIGLTNFANPGGLEKNGSNLYTESVNSGDAQFGGAGENGTGEIVPGTLEMSNVDLSEEFTAMIKAQRGFQANTRGITTADEVLQELMNLKR